MRISEGCVPHKGDTWHDLERALRTSAIGSTAAARALGTQARWVAQETQTRPAGPWSPQATPSSKKTIQSMSLLIFFLSIRKLYYIYLINTFNLN